MLQRRSPATFRLGFRSCHPSLWRNLVIPESARPDIVARDSNQDLTRIFSKEVRFPPADSLGHRQVKWKGSSHQGIKHPFCNYLVLHIGNFHYHEGQFGSTGLPSLKNHHSTRRTRRPVASHLPQRLPPHHPRRVCPFRRVNWGFCPPIYPHTFSRISQYICPGEIGDFLIAPPCPGPALCISYQLRAPGW